MCMFEMPTPCICCSEIFELNDGYPSQKWHPNTTICPNCHIEEQTEIEADQEVEEIKEELECHLNEASGYLQQLRDKNAPIPESEIIDTYDFWVKYSEEKPKYDRAYICYGIVNEGTEFERKQQFNAFWDGGQKRFVDRHGEDLILINESVEYWFNNTNLPNPNPRRYE